MKKKFIVRDEDKNEFEVEEVTEDVTDETVEEPTSLSKDEIDALKKLASISDKLVALVEIEKDEHANKPESEMLDEEEEEETEIVDEDEDDETEVVDTDEEIDKKEMIKRHDSKKSVGAITRKHKDSIADAHEIDIADAWSKRYGGNK